MPKVSIVMSVYNAELYLNKAIDSILNQTLSDFEFIIINDASTDSSLEIIESYKDERIKLINKTINKGFLGFVENLNFGIDQAKGKYIARMDADDISNLNRLEKQYKFLEDNPDIFLVGSDLNLIDKNDNKIGYLKSFSDHHKIVRKFNSENALYHPVIFFRNETDIRYRDKFKACEDFDFYLQLLSTGKKFGNINEPLLNYRILENSISRSESGFNKRLLMEISKDFFVERCKTNKDNYQLLKYDLSNLILKNDLKLSDNELRKALKVALLYNSSFYNDIYIKISKKSILDKIFLNKFLRSFYSRLKLKIDSKYGKISSNI